LVRLFDGSELRADYALVTFSLGVLQHDDVTFEPELPSWKKEAIYSMGMVRNRDPPNAAHLTLALPTGNIYQNLPPVPIQVLV